MTTAIEYALMAGASYISTRAEVNQFPELKACKKGDSFALLLANTKGQVFRPAFSALAVNFSP